MFDDVMMGRTGKLQHAGGGGAYKVSSRVRGGVGGVA